MKNNLIKFFLIFALNFFFIFEIQANDFNFNVTEIEITENGNIYNGIKGGTVTTNNGLKITSDNFKYNKSLNTLEAFGNVIVVNTQKNYTLTSNKISYLKNTEEIFTKGDTKVKIDNKYIFFGNDLYLDRNTMILSSLNNATVEDITSNHIYNLNNFHYLINEELLKGLKVSLTINKNDNPDSPNDKYFFESSIVDLKNQKFLAKDIEVLFDKNTYDNNQNDPRLKGTSASGDEYNTYLEKGIFTTCKNDGKCPPWKIESKNVRHDKKNKRILYKDAWLKVYDVPILYYPRFFHPDPTVKRQSGFLQPSTGIEESLGRSVYLPYFYAISDSKDMTIKPRYYNNNQIIIQSEYRQVTKNTSTVADFSFTKEKDNKTHIFIKSDLDLELDGFLNSKLDFQLQTVSNDTYLKRFKLKSPYFDLDQDALSSYISINLDKEGYDFSASATQYETLTGAESDRYQYTFPSYSFSKNFYLDDAIDGKFNFVSNGQNTISDTNVMATTVQNDLVYTSLDKYFDNGIKTNFNISLKNLNSIGKKHPTYKNTPQSELMSAYFFDASIPLIKENSTSLDTFTPKMSFNFSPHQMKNKKNSDSILTIENVFNKNRSGLGDTFAGGRSMTLGFDFKKQKKSVVINNNKKIKNIEDYFEMKLATVFRDKREDKMPIKSSLGEKQSDYVGQIKYIPTNNFSIDYNFAIDDSISNLLYSSVDTNFTIKNFNTTFSYIEENGLRGNTNLLENKTSYSIDSNNSLQFKTRRNREIDLTEYYDLVYQYNNDCLEASLQYRKSYYSNGDIKPSEDLFFTITIIPLTSFAAPDSIMRLIR